MVFRVERLPQRAAQGIERGPLPALQLILAWKLLVRQTDTPVGG